jgi:energy-coupling factor transporter transmembrane protein EcfT
MIFFFFHPKGCLYHRVTIRHKLLTLITLMMAIAIEIAVALVDDHPNLVIFESGL